MKAVAGSNVPAPLEDKTYIVKHGQFYAMFTIFLCFLPFLVGIPLTLALADKGHRNWTWLYGMGGIFGALHWAFRKSCKIVFHTDQTVSHINIMGKTIACQNRVPLSKYANIQVDRYGRVSYVKTDEYLAAIQSTLWCCKSCVPKAETYPVTDPEAFAIDHGMTDRDLKPSPV